MGLLFAIQLLLPLLLAAWPAVRSPADWLSWSLHLLALASVTAALHLSGLWSVLPWWLPWLFFILGLAVLAWRRPRKGGRQWLRCLVLAAMTAMAGWQAATALVGRKEPPVAAVDLAWPLPPGRYAVLNGGTNLAVSSHAETLDLDIPRHRLFHGQSYGLDVVALNALGRSTSGLWPADPRAYRIHGLPVLAPCSGTVVAAVDGVEDQQVPDPGPDAQAGNHVLLRCGSVDVLLAHFAPGTLKVRAGDRVRPGVELGRAGNSGASNEPHLHIHAQRRGTPDAPLSGAPVPLRLDGRWLVRGDRVTIPG